MRPSELCIHSGPKPKILKPQNLNPKILNPQNLNPEEKDTIDF